jgi:hypothetical protein
LRIMPALALGGAAPLRDVHLAWWQLVHAVAAFEVLAATLLAGYGMLMHFADGNGRTATWRLGLVFGDTVGVSEALRPALALHGPVLVIVHAVAFGAYVARLTERWRLALDVVVSCFFAHSAAALLLGHLSFTSTAALSAACVLSLSIARPLARRYELAEIAVGRPASTSTAVRVGLHADSTGHDKRARSELPQLVAT